MLCRVTLALACLCLGGAALVPGVKAECRWEPDQEIVCRAYSYGRHTPRWEVRDTSTGELLAKAKGAYVRLTLSPDRWRDVELISSDRGSTRMRLMWGERRLKSVKVNL